MKRLSIVVMALLMGLFTWQVVLQEDDPGEADEETVSLLQERGLNVLPLEVVTESEAEVLDITDDSARVNFIGTIPLACTVVYGTTTDFGSASIDLDMNGGAIIEHNPVMRNLEPDTEYFFRLQGSDENGTLYTSEIMSFRTAEASDEPIENLLSPERGAEVIGVSSIFGNQPDDGVWGILNAFDNDLNTAWSSNGDGDDAWFEVQLGQRSQINQVEFQTRLMTDGTARIESFMITTGEGEEFGPFEVPDAEQIHQYDVDFEAQSIRFDVVSSTGGNTGVVDMALYGEPIEE